MSFDSLRLGLAFACASAMLVACGGGDGSSVPTESPKESKAAAVVSSDADTTHAKAATASRAYIVQLADDPVTAYAGGVAGMAATKPAKGQKINPNSAAVRNYMAYLASRQDALLAGVGGGRKLYNYGYVFNGFAAELSAEQAHKLAQTSGVLAVSADEKRQMDTSTSPAFLGLSAPDGLWSQLSGNGNGNPVAGNGPNSGGAGEGVVVGIIDSGIWPENPSFSDRDAGGMRAYKQIPGWHGKCTPGEDFNASNCNQKLISAQWFGEGFGGQAVIKEMFPYEFWSARGASAHGSHTAGTAAGNYGVTAVANGNNLGTISGMAPRARIAVYKVCWGIGGAPAGCASSDSVKAIDQAVADGVDVLNYSISGSTTSNVDPVELAFLRAADAGVFVAASAGNNGPAASTVAHNSPWLTTVAAGTKNTSYQATATLGNGAVYVGVGVGAAVPSSPLILSTDAALAGANLAAAALCFSTQWNGSPVLDPAKVAGKIVVCDRGTSDRVDKSLAVKEAGGVGMILSNTSSAQSLNADLHSVPTVHLPSTDRAALLAYGATVGATASLGASQQAFVVAPDVAGFSSRGPARAAGGNLLKPDIMGPGVDILAAMSPIEGGENFGFLSGTSMSSPHLAGIGALYKQKYPKWSPAAIKSALMTTASQTRTDGSPIAGGAFAYGAGQVVPNNAVNPGLVFDAGYSDWVAFLCGSGQIGNSFCASIAINPSNLNYPSIAVGALAGVQTVTRTVTNVGSTAATYTPSVEGLAGITVKLPDAFSIKPGASKTYSITFTTAGAAIGAYAQGAVVLTSNQGHVVRSPVVVRPVAMAAPTQVSGSYSVTFGYTGPFSATPRGLVAAGVQPGSVATGGQMDFQVNVPAGTTYARFSLFDSEVSQASDLDLEVYGPTGSQVGGSGGGTSDEEVNLSNPAAGTYTVRVLGYAVPNGGADFKLFSWALGSTAAGNMSVTAPANATVGQVGNIVITTNDLTAGAKYLGAVIYGGIPGGQPSSTIVRIDN